MYTYSTDTLFEIVIKLMHGDTKKTVKVFTLASNIKDATYTALGFVAQKHLSSSKEIIRVKRYENIFFVDKPNDIM